MAVDGEFCKALPKIELHAHLGGSIRDGTILDLARKHCSPEDVAKIEKVVSCTLHLDKGTAEDQSIAQLEVVFAAFSPIHQATSNIDDIARITTEVVDDFAGDGVEEKSKSAFKTLEFVTES